MRPPLGTPADRQALKQALAQGLITAVAVHHQALDPEEQLLPLDQRQVGVDGSSLCPAGPLAGAGGAGWVERQCPLAGPCASARPRC